MAGWRFYGRGEELARLSEVLQLEARPDERRNFAAYTVIGRRGVGKSELIRRVAELAGHEVPVVVCELPRPEANGDASAALRRLLRAVSDADCGIALDGLPPPDRWTDDQMRFTDIVGRLIEKGTVVVLDEFQHAEPLGLVSDVKLMIDRFTSSLGPRPSGKLVLSGSHQQRIVRMFSGDQPLYGRATTAVALRQWPAETVLEMAAEQGFLSRPKRFLTLWTAYGGLPRGWERFSSGSEYSSLRDFGAPDDHAWRQAFLHTEFRQLSRQGERFDSRMFIELPGHLREALLWMGTHPARGQRTIDFPARIAAMSERGLDADLQLLMNHTELVELHGRFLGKPEEIEWRISDNGSLFQLKVFQEVFHPKQARADRPRRSGDPSRAQPVPPAAADRLLTLEGTMLKRFTAEWLLGQPGAEMSEAGVRRTADIEVDLLAETTGGGGSLILGSCKRRAGSHRPGTILRDFRKFSDSLAGERRAVAKSEAERLLALPRKHIAVSPLFTQREREWLGESGLECLDIREMALRCGIEPGPLAEDDPEPPAEPQPDGSPDFGM